MSHDTSGLVPLARRALGALVAIFMLAGIGLVASAPAGAAKSEIAFSRQYGQALTGVLAKGETWLGSYRAGSAMGVTYAWCMQGGATAPSKAGKSKTLSAPALSYALATWSGSNFGGSSKNETHAALSFLVHSKYDTGFGAVSATSRRSAYVSKTPAKIKNIASKMWTEATKYAGSYTARLSLTRTGATTADLTGVGVRTSSVNFVPGFKGSVSLSGPATFKNGDRSKSFTTATSGHSWQDLKITGPGTITARVTITNLPAQNVTVWSGQDNVFGQNGTVQDMITPLRINQSASDSINPSPQNLTISTVASTIEPVGTELAHQDTVTVSAPARFAGEKVNITAYLRYHGPSVPSRVAVSSTASIPGSPRGEVSTTVTLNANGNATWVTPKLTTAQQAGYYTWVVASEPAANGLLSRFISDYGIPAETRPWSLNPTVSTRASASEIRADGSVTITDEIFGYNFPAGQQVTHRATLYRHPDGVSMPGPGGVATIPAGAVAVGTPIVTTVTANAQGHAHATVTRDVMQRAVATNYTWVVTTDAIPGWAGYTSPYGIREESVIVDELNPDAPLIGTQVSDQEAAPGQTISDTYLITQANAITDAYPLEVTSRLWHLTEEPVFNADITDQPGTPVLVDTAQLAPMSHTAPTFEVSLRHPFQIPSDPALAGGWWVYTYCFADTGDWADGTPEPDRINGYAGACDTTVYVNETAFVPWNPRITTVASPAVADAGVIGDTVADTVSVTGGKPGSEVTIRLTAYEPTVQQPTRTAWANMPERPASVYSDDVTIRLNAAGAGSGSVSGFEAEQPGFYPWTDTLIEADPGTEGVGIESDYGIPAELALIKFRPTVTTMASHQTAVAGDLLTDQFTVEHLPPNTTVTVTHSGWCSQVEPTLQDEVPAGAQLAGTVTSRVTSNAAGEVGVRTTPHIVAPTACPYFVWTERIPEGPFHEEWTSPYGIASEVTRVVSVTTKANPYAQAGTTTYDVATVSGPVPAGSMLYFDYYREVDSDDPANDELLATLGPVAVNGPGDYLSPTVDVSDTPGKEYFRERLYTPNAEGQIDLDGPPTIHGRPRLPDETTIIVDVSSTADKAVKVGEKFSDTVHVDLGADLPEGSYLRWDVIENTGKKNAVLTETGYEGDTHLVTTKPVTIDGSGDYRAPKQQVDRDTTVHWVEALYVPGRAAPIAVGGYRIKSETTRITDDPTPDITDEPELPQTGGTLAFYLGLAGLALIVSGAGIFLLRSRETTTV
ncbi:LPXTG-motif cell wall anchor domain-containing protein [Micrococcales bacterium KH10]|nr:LPXTG-motif cell wall anchor domain-containing protein [Micrococcales bacterium KH10]